LSRDARLRNSPEFRSVYENGRRFDGRFLTVFILVNAFDQHRLGITASRKMSRHAVKRNRAKRLVREAFRLSAAELNTLGARYDWVFNTRRSLVEGKAADVVEELRGVIGRLRRGEVHAPEKAGS
jgi:ribonuclease P protein component